MILGNQKVKVPTSPKTNTDMTRSTMHKFHNLAQEVLDYIIIHNIELQDLNRLDTITYTNGYLEGAANKYMPT